MKMQVPLIFTACIVIFGLRFVQPHDRIGNEAVIDKAYEESKTENNLQKLFESLVKSDDRKKGTLREVIEQQVANERQAFNGMKEEFRSVRHENVHKKNNFYYGSHARRNFVETKRETKAHDGSAHETNANTVNHENLTTSTATSVNHPPVPKNAFKLRVMGYTMITPRVLQLTLVRTDGLPLEFIAGQFITFLLPHKDKFVRRSYSLANCPDQSEKLEVAIAPVEGGFATKILFNLTVGDELYSTGPLGKLILDQTSDISHLVLVGTGTGIAPYRSMLPTIAKKLDENKIQKVTVLLGVRHADELLYAEDFIAFHEKYDRFYFRAYLSKPNSIDPPYQYSGYVQTAFESLHLNPSMDFVYLCGNPNMVDDSFHKLTTTFDFKPQRIIREKYASRGV